MIIILTFYGNKQSEKGAVLSKKELEKELKYEMINNPQFLKLEAEVQYEVINTFEANKCFEAITISNNKSNL